jgi:uncharacterized protein YnzC (UPF0291/DUF896 family)
MIIAKSNLLEKNILNNYLENFGYNNIQNIEKINELGKAIAKDKENILFIDQDFVKGFDISSVAKSIKSQIQNIKIVTFDATKESIDNIDVVLNNINKETLSIVL